MKHVTKYMSSLTVEVRLLEFCGREGNKERKGDRGDGTTAVKEEEMRLRV
jgi:hypothetical protein